MISAKIDVATGEIVNLVMADPRVDSVGAGFVLVAIDPHFPIDKRWIWSEYAGFQPGPELAARIAADAANVEAEAFDLGGIQ